MNGVEDGAKVYFCALVLKVAGTASSYDCGLCSHTLDKKKDKNSTPNDEELEEMKSRWEISDKYFSKPPYRQDPAVIEEFKTSTDAIQDWRWREDMTFLTELVPDTAIVKFKCPVLRLMNT
jgi:hypothetical protein